MLLAGCQGKTAGMDEAPDAVYVPSYSRIDFEGSLEGSSISREFFLQGDYLYHAGPDVVTAVNLNNGERTEKEIKGSSWKRTGNGFVSISTMAKKIYVYDESFEQTGEIDLTAYGAALQGSIGYTDFTVDTKGRGAILRRNTIYVLDEEGKILFFMEKPDELLQFSAVFSGKNEDLYVLAFDSGSQAVVYPIDIPGQGLGERLANIPDISSSATIIPLNEEEIYFAESGLYLYNTAEQTCRCLCSLRDYGIIADIGDACGVLTEGCFGIIETDSASFGSGGCLAEELELIRIEAKQADQVQEREELILAAMNAPHGQNAAAHSGF